MSAPPSALRAVGLALLLGACGSSPPPPPVPTPSGSGLRPLSAHEETEPADAPLPSPTGEAKGTPGPGSSLARAEGVAGGSISGTVQLAAALKSRQSPGDVLYIIARNSQTSVVVAVRREGEVRFPLSFELSSADAMMTDTSFTGPLDVIGRLSKTGDALPAKGDLEGVVRGVAVGTRGLSITLDTIRP